MYSANLVREPQLIGSGYINFFLRDLLSSEVSVSYSRDMATDLLNTMKPGKIQVIINSEILSKI